MPLASGRRVVSLKTNTDVLTDFGKRYTDAQVFGDAALKRQWCAAVKSGAFNARMLVSMFLSTSCTDWNNGLDEDQMAAQVRTMEGQRDQLTAAFNRYCQ